MKTCALLSCVLLTLAGCPAWAGGEIVTGPDRLSEIDLRIEALDARREQISLTGPKVATAVGGLVFLLGGVALGVGFTRFANDCFECESGVPGIISGVALTCAGGLTSLVGGIVWGVRAHRRNEIDAERDSLIEQRAGLAATLSRLELPSTYRDDAHFVTLGVRF